MSGNSCESALQTAPMVRDLTAGPCGGASGPAGRLPSAAGSAEGSLRVGSATSLARQVGELVLADLELVAVLEAVRVDPAAAHVGAVERARVVEIPLAGAAHEHRVVARDRDVVEEDLRLRGAPDGQALAAQRERLADAPAAGADDERAALRGHVAHVDRPQLAGLLVDDVGGRRDVVARRLVRPLEGAALGAVVRRLTDDEAAFGAVTRHAQTTAEAAELELVAARRAAGEDVREPLHVGARDDLLTALVLLAQPVDQLGAEDVDLAVQDAAAVGHLLLLVRELLDEVLELLVRERPQVGEGVHRVPRPLLGDWAHHSNGQAEVEAFVPRTRRIASRR